MGREAGCHKQWNTGSHAPPSPGRRALSIVDIALPIFNRLQCGGIAVYVQTAAAAAATAAEAQQQHNKQQQQQSADQLPLR